MGANNLFQGYSTQNPGNCFANGNQYYYRYGDMNMSQPQPYGGFINRTNMPSQSNIPVRVVFSPEQIVPQDIPTNGSPAIFPLNDGSRIIVRSLLENGLFDERVYVLQQNNQSENSQPQISEFDQVMTAIGKVEDSLNKVLTDLYGTKAQPSTTSKQEGGASKNE